MWFVDGWDRIVIKLIEAASITVVLVLMVIRGIKEIRYELKRRK